MASGCGHSRCTTFAALSVDAGARLLLGAKRRRPGVPAEDLLHPRTACDRHALRVRLGGIAGIAHLRTRDSRWDMRSYVAIHLSWCSAWACWSPDRSGRRGRGACGGTGASRRWSRSCSIILLYATYQPLRFAIEDPERQARYASVFAITARRVRADQLLAVRLSTAYLHPRVLGDISANLPGRFQVVFYLSLISIGAAVRSRCGATR